MSRQRRILLTALALGVLLFGLLTERWFISPTKDDPGVADAIFVLGGGGEREAFALDLVRSGVSTEVVFAAEFLEEYGVWAAKPCNETPPDLAPEPAPEDITFDCFAPSPVTTRGEARLLSTLATERGWSSVVVVASTDQITRARRLIERCWDGDLRVTGPDHHDPWIFRAVYEWGAGIKATILRSC